MTDIKYNGFIITRHTNWVGSTYYKILGEDYVYIKLKDAKAEIDQRLEKNKEEE